MYMLCTYCDIIWFKCDLNGWISWYFTFIVTIEYNSKGKNYNQHTHTPYTSRVWNSQTLPSIEAVFQRLGLSFCGDLFIALSATYLHVYLFKSCTKHQLCVVKSVDYINPFEKDYCSDDVHIAICLKARNYFRFKISRKLWRNVHLHIGFWNVWNIYTWNSSHYIFSRNFSNFPTL